MTNNGGAPLSNVTVTDSLFGAITLNTNALAPGPSATSSRSIVVQESHLPGPLVGNITATGTPPCRRPPTSRPTRTTSVALGATPQIAVTSAASRAAPRMGQSIAYTFTVTNNGNMTLSNVVANDTRFGALLPAPATLQPGQASSRRALPVTEGLLPGPVTNSVTVTGTPPANLPPVTATANSAVNLTYSAALQVARMASPNPAGVGQAINYLFTVRNIGNVTLSDLGGRQPLERRRHQRQQPGAQRRRRPSRTFTRSGERPARPAGQYAGRDGHAARWPARRVDLEHRLGHLVSNAVFAGQPDQQQRTGGRRPVGHLHLHGAQRRQRDAQQRRRRRSFPTAGGHGARQPGARPEHHRHGQRYGAGIPICPARW